jgi:hypothetical protein
MAIFDASGCKIGCFWEGHPSRTSVLHNLQRRVTLCSLTDLSRSPLPHHALNWIPIHIHLGSVTMSAPSLTNYIVKRPWLKRWMMPLAQWYTDAAGYRKLGLR